LAPSLKNYESPCSAFVPHILDYVLRILYRSPTGFIETYRHVPEVNKNIEKWISKIIKTMSKRSYFKGRQINGAQNARCLALIKELVLLTGEGNSMYLPVFHYLEECNEAKLLF
jgi:hypothetical protein